MSALRFISADKKAWKNRQIKVQEPQDHLFFMKTMTPKQHTPEPKNRPISAMICVYALFLLIVIAFSWVMNHG